MGECEKCEDDAIGYNDDGVALCEDCMFEWFCAETEDVGYESCYNCCGFGYFDAHDEDPVNIPPGSEYICDVCEGSGELPERRYQG
jgi:hypothetical protein